MKIDSHVHVWQLARGDYDWLTPDLAIHRDYGLADLRPLLGDIGAVVLVQAAATEAETAFMLRVAHASGGLVRAVVGWTDLADHDAPDRVQALAADPLLRGLRPMLQDIEDTHWIMRSDVQRGLQAMAHAGLSLDLLITPRHLPLLPELANRHPDLPMVIDHAAKPDIGAGAFRTWADEIAAAAQQPQMFCKFSGLVTQAGPAWQPATLQPYVAHVLACFGPDRTLWGSDWPVLTLSADYARWRDTAWDMLPDHAREAVFGRTAATFYRISAATDFTAQA